MPAAAPAIPKKRKKGKAPAVISDETWAAIQQAICVGGLGYSEAGRKFGVEPHAIMGKAKRNGWPVDSKITERVEALQKRSKRCESNRNGNEQVIQAVAESWVQRGEASRVVSFNLAHAALQQAERKGLPIDSWRDAHLASQVARKAAGLEDGGSVQVNFALELVNQRLLSPALDIPNFPPD